SSPRPPGPSSAWRWNCLLRCPSRRTRRRRARTRIPRPPTARPSWNVRTRHASSQRLWCAPFLPRPSDHLQRLGVVARGGVVLLQAVQRRLLLQAPPAPVLVEAGELRAPCTEPATRRRIRRARQVALQQDPPAGPLLVRVRQRD